MIEFKRKRIVGDTVYLSKNVSVPYSTIKQSNIQVDKYIIVKNKKTKLFEVGVWNSELSKFNMDIFKDCNTKVLNETILKINDKVRLGG